MKLASLMARSTSRMFSNMLLPRMKPRWDPETHEEKSGSVESRIELATNRLSVLTIERGRVSFSRKAGEPQGACEEGFFGKQQRKAWLKQRERGGEEECIATTTLWRM